VGHFAVVHSMDDVSWVIEELKRDKKIANATHNIAAWRISTTNVKGSNVLVRVWEAREFRFFVGRE
jgi:putative IMPACT (imprinted ancient) family translation regulator